MTTQEFTAALDEVKEDLRDLFQLAVATRNAAQDVLNAKHELESKITRMQNKAMQDELGKK